MKSLKKLVLAGVALLMLAAVPMTAHAYEFARPVYAYGYAPYRSFAWDRHNIHAQFRDIAHDRFALREDLATHNWAAARAERADIRHDLFHVQRDRFFLYRGY
jgi:hypothetical protein